MQFSHGSVCQRLKASATKVHDPYIGISDLFDGATCAIALLTGLPAANVGASILLRDRIWWRTVYLLSWNAES